MAYFSNGSEGSQFEEECSDCKLGQEPCPIAWIQADCNYEACNNPVARKILDHLVSNEGVCSMKKLINK